MRKNNKEIYSINDRISQIIDYFNITRYKFSQKTGISETVLLNIYKVKNKPSFDVLEKILNNYSVINAEWLLTGNGSMIKRKISENEKETPLINTNNITDIFSDENKVAEDKYDSLIVPTLKEADFFFRIKGVSMYPKYFSGDIVACKKLPADTFFQWNKVYMLDTDQGPLIKRVKKGSIDDTLLLVSENTDYEPFELHRSQIYNIAIVTGYIRIE